MLSKSLLEKLNHQINLEHYSANLYLQMSSWCLAQGLAGCGAFLRAHSNEEQDHMFRLFDYVNETGSKASVEGIEAPPSEFGSLMELLEAIYEHECKITQEINKLVKAALEEGDFSTFNFLQWYVAEQHEEENLFASILDKARIIGTEGRGLFLIDQEIGKLKGDAGIGP